VFKTARYIYFTNNVDGMVAFYRDVLGLRQLSPPDAMDYDPKEWVQLAGDGFEIAIHGAEAPGCTAHNRNKLVFHVDDVAAARAYLQEKGVKVGEHHVWGPDLEACDFEDPDGNTVQISTR
jgi:catechol 2,3-dioxygenase-like lactoylglutathione lyase family enzyme